MVDLHTLQLPARGPRLLLLPSNGMCAEFYLPLGRLLAARGLASTLVTLPGYDGTPPLKPLTWDALIELTLPRARESQVLVGHSLGGNLALQLAARLGSKLPALVLVEPAVSPFPWLTRWGAALYRRRVVDQPRGMFRTRGPWFRRLHDPAGFPPAALEIALRSNRTTHHETERDLVLGSARLDSSFAQVTAPTLLIRAGSSGFVMHLGQRLLARKLPRAQCVTIPRAGHWLANEQDEALAKAISTFVLEPRVSSVG